MASIPEKFHHLFEQRTFAHISTVLPDGKPHVTPVWIDYNDEQDHVLVNTFRGSRKERNIRLDPHVAISMTDSENGDRFLIIRGEVAEVTEDGAVDHINELARRYMGRKSYPRLQRETAPRVQLKIEPNRVIT
jgi:PPOX class probable F420-dependent enzyme